MAGTYEIQPHSEATPQAQSNDKTTFYVNFIASNSTESGVQYYECETTDVAEIRSILQSVADSYDAMILAQPVVGQVNGL